MVTTRSRVVGLVDERSSRAAASSNESRSGRKRRRSGILDDANEDAYADCAPEERSFYRDIVDRASVGDGKRKKSKSGGEEAEASPLPSPSKQLLLSCFEEEASSPSGSQAEEQEHVPTSGQNRPQEPQYEGRPVSANSNKESARIENKRKIHAENITRITSISVDMPYIEPEPEGVTPVIYSLGCSGINKLIRCMKKKEWTNEGGDWSLELLSPDDKEKTGHKWTAPKKKSDSKNCTLFLKQTVDIGNVFHAMPKNTASQSQALRERSKDIKAWLCSMRHLAQKMKEQVLQAESRASKARKANNNRLVKSMRERLIPVLVLVLKEALLLGGSSTICEENKPEEIAPEEGNFMACTLQFPLRIIGCIDQLWPVIRDSVKGPAHSQKFGLFDRHLSALRKLLLQGMEDLREIAGRPQNILEGKQNDEHCCNLRAEQSRRYLESQTTQLMYCSASSQLLIGETHDDNTSLGCQGRQGRKESRTDGTLSIQKRFSHESERKTMYRENNGWSLEEDLVLLRSIRRTENLDAEKLAKTFPERTVTEVLARITVLKTLTREYLSKEGRPPPKWCY
ncbi:hypothetical protein E4U55_002448 [Claviceps digitariae]|nr:hypothetical protein E4U55_002448 [Claviceps digitariae]